MLGCGACILNYSAHRKLDTFFSSRSCAGIGTRTRCTHLSSYGACLGFHTLAAVLAHTAVRCQWPHVVVAPKSRIPRTPLSHLGWPWKSNSPASLLQCRHFMHFMPEPILVLQITFLHLSVLFFLSSILILLVKVLYKS